MKARILIVEDDANLAAGLEYNLARAGYDVMRAADGTSALSLAASFVPDLVVLDLLLPGVDGFGVLEGLAASGRRVPVVILSALASERDKVRGFDSGATDYVSKPFGMEELLARIRARLAPVGPAQRFGLGDQVVDLVDGSVTRGGERTPLTPTEAEILRRLHARAGMPVPRADLLYGVWGITDTLSRTLDTHVTRLRKKLEPDPARPRHLMTVHSVGYRLVP